MLAAQPLAASAQTASDVPRVEVLRVHGVIDPSIAGYVRAGIEEAERSGATVVLQIDSHGSYGDEALRLAGPIRDASVPVVAWVGPAGARAAGGALFLLYASSLATMAPGAGVGPARPFDLGTTAEGEDEDDASAGRRGLASLAAGSGASPAGVDRVLDAALAAGPASDAGAVALVAPRVLPDSGPGVPGSTTEGGLPGLLSAIDGRTVSTAAGSVVLATEDRSIRHVEIRVGDLGPVQRILHAVATPTAFYVLLVLGLWSVAFELTQPGVGVAGIAGAAAVALAGYALTVIPVNWLGLALLLAGIGLQALDVVVRRVALFTAAGTVAFAAGSVLAWSGVAPAVDLSLWLIGFATLAGFLFFGFAMTVALRARERVRSSQVALVGLVGETRGDLDPEGAVYVKGTLWRARSMDGRIPKGTRVRVRGVDGLILRVDTDPEPEPDPD